MITRALRAQRSESRYEARSLAHHMRQINRVARALIERNAATASSFNIIVGLVAPLATEVKPCRSP